MSLRSPLGVLLLALALCSTTQALQLSENGCQCTGGCNFASYDIIQAGKKFCKTGSECTERDGDNEDVCGAGWGANAVSSITSLFSAGKATAAKVAGWAAENVQQISLNDVAAKAAEWTASVTAKLSISQWAAIDLDTILAFAEDKLKTIPVDLIAGWSVDTLEQFKDKVVDFTLEQVQALDKDWVQQNLLSFSVEVWAKISASQLADLSMGVLRQVSVEQWSAINTAAILDWSAERLKEIPTAAIADWSIEQLKDIPVSTITGFALDQLKAIPYDKIGQLAQEQWDQIPVGKLAGLLWEQLQQAPWERLAQLTQEEWNKIPVEKLVMLGADQIRSIDPEVVANWSQKYWDKVPVYQLVYMTSEQINSYGVVNLPSEKLASLSQAQWNSVPIDDLAQLSVEQLQSVDYEALAAWTDEQWDAVPVDNLVLLTGAKVRSIPASKVEAFTQEQWTQVPVKEIIIYQGERINNKATLAKLSIDMLAEYAKTGELDTTLLEEEVRRQVEAKIEMWKDDKVETYSRTRRIITLVLSHAAAEQNARDTELVYLSLKTTAGSEQDSPKELADAETKYEMAAATEEFQYDQLAATGYVQPRPQPTPAANPAGWIAFGVLLGVVCLAVAGGLCYVFRAKIGNACKKTRGGKTRKRIKKLEKQTAGESV